MVSSNKIFGPDLSFSMKNRQGKLRFRVTMEGMFFDFYMYNLFPGRVYTFDFFVKDRGVEFVVDDVGTRFRLDE